MLAWRLEPALLPSLLHGLVRGVTSVPRAPPLVIEGGRMASVLVPSSSGEPHPNQALAEAQAASGGGGPNAPRVWLPSLEGVVKINVDGALARSRRGGAVAAVCRDHTGTYLGSSAVVYNGIRDPTILETYACREALALAQDLQLQNMIVASDAKQVVQEINNRSRGVNGAIISEIHSYSSLFQCIFSFESRRANIEAHKLAKHSLSLGPGRHVWFGQPHDLTCIPQSVVLN